MKFGQFFQSTCLVALSLTLTLPVVAAQKPLELTDIMHFKSLQKPVIAENGQVFAVEAAPDRGESQVLVKPVYQTKTFEIAGGSAPKVSQDGRYVIATIEPSLLDKETKEKKELSNKLALLDTQTGKQQDFEKVKSASFSPNGAYLVVWFDAEKTADTDKNTEEKADNQLQVDKSDKGSTLSLIHLKSNKTLEFPHATAFAFDENSINFAVAVNHHDAQKHEIQLVNLTHQSARVLFTQNQTQMGELALTNDGRFIGFTSGELTSKRDEREYALHIVDIVSGKQRQPSSKGWVLNQYSTLQFSRDSERLFVGRVPQIDELKHKATFSDESSLFDINVITDNKNLRVWHGDDPKIKPHEVKEYANKLKRTYLAVYHLQADHFVQLADKTMPTVDYDEQKRYLVGRSDVPYQKMITWAGFFEDIYLVDMNTGRKQLVLAQYPSGQAPTLSPNARYLRYYQQGGIYLYDIAKNSSVLLSRQLGVSFADEDHDYPSDAPGCGFGPWLADGSGFIAYDKYDAWQFNTSSHAGFMLTDGKGRQEGIAYRVTGLVKDKAPTYVTDGEQVLLHGYSHRTKADNFYQASIGKAGIKQLTKANKAHKMTLLARAKKSDEVLFSQERFDLYPDIYSANYQDLANIAQQTSLDSQRQAFDWGQAELVQWTSADGDKLDGVLIKPANYEAGKQYPVMVYYYRFMSDRLHAFPDMKVNHRPNFAWYTNNGYAIFLPDIRFEIGYPGQSAVKALTSGVQHIIEMGIADPKKVGLHGHSWSGYQTAFAVTQTHMFAAAVSGAPVSNMTSAYSGIRHGSGLARQFQYETGQSRIGPSLYKAPQMYIENSPIFYVERMKTPMMIMFGDIDDAVPWEQGVELYLAMRRAGKDVVFLQYEGEPHHLKKYPNKVDYTIKMREYFDHYLLGKPAPRWLSEGEPYQEFATE